ncbi:hypothetical protein BH10BAC5_BH10BAC5_25850 [soil metagenome]
MNDVTKILKSICNEHHQFLENGWKRLFEITKDTMTNLCAVKKHLM